VSALDPPFVAWFYNLTVHVPFVRAVHRRFVARALAQCAPGGRGLDVGTGPGAVAVQVARQCSGLSIVGLDLAGHMVERAQRQAVRVGLDGHGLWPQADAHRLPFADDSFDWVISSFALHHWDDPLAAFNEMARVLAPGGAYYIADVCREADVLQRLFAYASIPVVSLPLGSYLAYGGYYESLRAGYTRAEARQILTSSDLPPGDVGLDSTWFVPILTISSRVEAQ
jgi:ubiquinone/menaquinone biosynthesis C-methylase UbiE